MKIFIVCSKHNYDKVKPIVAILKDKGHKIHLPNGFNEPEKESEMQKMSKEEFQKWKENMLKEDEKIILQNDAIFVLNFEKKGIPNYIGGATFLEMFNAWRLKRKIFLYNPLPNCSFTDELKAFGPIIINGNLEMIK
ncbi:MAG: hypothetical protein WC548_03170 [Candidatus Pacearchaeota archaeon]